MKTFLFQIHAYIPEGDGLDDEDIQTTDDFVEEKKKKGKPVGKKRKKKIKEEFVESYEDLGKCRQLSFNFL